MDSKIPTGAISKAIEKKLLQSAMKQIDVEKLMVKLKPQLEKQVGIFIVSIFNDSISDTIYDIFESKEMKDMLRKRIMKSFK